MKRIRTKLASLLEAFKKNQVKGAQATILEELFNDLYMERRKIYRLNFFRGIFFGLGSVIGGTIVLALLVWLLSLFINFPVIGHFFEDTKSTLQETTR